MKSHFNRFFFVTSLLLAIDSRKRPDGSYELLQEIASSSYDVFWRLTHPNYTPASKAERWVIKQL